MDRWNVVPGMEGIMRGDIPSEGMTEGDVARGVIWTEIIQRRINEMNSPDPCGLRELVTLAYDLCDMLALITGPCMAAVAADARKLVSAAKALDTMDPAGWDTYAEDIESIGHRMADYGASIRTIQAMRPILDGAYNQIVHEQGLEQVFEG